MYLTLCPTCLFSVSQQSWHQRNPCFGRRMLQGSAVLCMDTEEEEAEGSWEDFSQETKRRPPLRVSSSSTPQLLLHLRRPPPASHPVPLLSSSSTSFCILLFFIKVEKTRLQWMQYKYKRVKRGNTIRGILASNSPFDFYDYITLHNRISKWKNIWEALDPRLSVMFLDKTLILAPLRCFTNKNSIKHNTHHLPSIPTAPKIRRGKENTERHASGCLDKFEDVNRIEPLTYDIWDTYICLPVSPLLCLPFLCIFICLFSYTTP